MVGCPTAVLSLAHQGFINPVEFTLAAGDSFDDPQGLLNGVRSEYTGTDGSDEIDLSDATGGYRIWTSGGIDTIVATPFADVIDLGTGTSTIDGGEGEDVLDINVMLDQESELVVAYSDVATSFTVSESIMDTAGNSVLTELFTVTQLLESGGWIVESTAYGKDTFNLGNATLENIESVRVFHGYSDDGTLTDQWGNSVPRALYQTMYLASANNDSWRPIEGDGYSLVLPPASWTPSGWALGANGTTDSEVIDLAQISVKEDLEGTYGIDVDTIYTRIDGQGGNDWLYGAGGMDSLRVNFANSNYLDGRANPSYLSNGNFFSAHDRFVVWHDVENSESLDLSDYVLVSVKELIEQATGSIEDVLLTDLGTTELGISSIVDLMNGELVDLAALPFILAQISDKAGLLALDGQTLGDLDAFLIKVQEITAEGVPIIEVDFVKNIDMISVLGRLPDGSTFTAHQGFINPVEFTLAAGDSFDDPQGLLNGVRSEYTGTDGSDEIDLSDATGGYRIWTSGGIDTIVATPFADVIDLGTGTSTIDGGEGEDVLDINVMLEPESELVVAYSDVATSFTVSEGIVDTAGNSVLTELFTVTQLLESGGWIVESTAYGKATFDLGNATLENIESVRVFHGYSDDGTLTDQWGNSVPRALYQTM